MSGVNTRHKKPGIGFPARYNTSVISKIFLLVRSVDVSWETNFASILACHLKGLVKLLPEGRVGIGLGKHVPITISVEWVLLGYCRDATSSLSRKFINNCFTLGYPLEGSGGVESSPLDFFPPGTFSSSFRFVPLPRPPASFRSDIFLSLVPLE